MFEYMFGFVSVLILGFFAGYGRSKAMLVLISAAYATSWLVGGKAIYFFSILIFGFIIGYVVTGYDVVARRL